MREDSTQKPLPLPIKVGIGLTIMLLMMIAYLGSIYRCVLLATGTLECRYNLHWFLDAAPNEIGDSIAGVFATLAFVWIVVTVFLQSAELTEQRRELSLTREELLLARVAQEKQLEVMQRQADIFENEQQQRTWENSKRTLDTLIDAIAIRIEKEGSLKDNFTFRPRSEREFRRALPFSNVKGSTSEDTVRTARDSLRLFQERLFEQGAPQFSNLVRKSAHHMYYRMIKMDIDYALSLKPRLSEDQEIRLHVLELAGSADVLEAILNADVWNHGTGAAQ